MTKNLKEEEESNPLLPTTDNEKVVEEENELTSKLSSPPLPPSKENPVPPMMEPNAEEGGNYGYGWTADGVPLSMMGMGVGMGMGMGRVREDWSSGLCNCFGNYDHHFVGTDLEVCLLGSIAPCVLYASNAERLGSNSGSFTNHCMTYTALYLIGNSFFGWNCLAPWFSYSTRTAVRRSFNLEGNCEALTRQCGCGGSLMEDEAQREQCEMACDFATHLLCHPCSLCQEGREIRRRIPHPGFNTQPVVVMVPPGAQSMGRH